MRTISSQIRRAMSSSTKSMSSITFAPPSFSMPTTNFSRVDVVIFLLVFASTIYLELFSTPNVQPASLDDPSLKKPVLPSIVSSSGVLVIGFILPFLVLLFIRKTIPPLTFALGLINSNLLTLFTTNSLKVIIGRPRPFFANVCQSYDPPDSFNCTGDPLKVNDSRRSFPSGHSSLSFSAAVFVSLCIARTFYMARYDSSIVNTSSMARMKLLPIVLVSIPLTIAALVASSRLIDFHHHYADVVAGSLLGSFFGAASFFSHVITNNTPQNSGSVSNIAESTIDPDERTDLEPNPV